MRKLIPVLVAGLAVATAAHGQEIVLENTRFRAVIGENAMWRSLVEKATGCELCPIDHRLPMALARVGGKSCAASKASLAGDRLTVEFAGCDTRVVYRVESQPDWITLYVVEITGSRPDRLTLLRGAATIAERAGSILGAAWNADLAVCLRAATLSTQVSVSRRGEWTELSATTQDEPGPRLEEAAVAIVVAPTGELRGILHRLSLAYELPHNHQDGVASKDLDIARGSYWFLGFGEKDVEQVIECCQRTGFRQVMLSSGAWCSSPGHYTINTVFYPAGLESLRRTVAKLHAEGILVGMHCFASKVAKHDAFVTPAPDRRFWVDREATLADPMAANATTITLEEDLREWPGSPVASQKVWEGGVDKHRDVVIDDEIVCYESIGPEGKWNTLLGCRRGAYGTRAASHGAGTAVRHYGVDGCINGYIIDQETDLLEEVAGRLAEVFNDCDFDMVYFDGSEDVDRRRFNYYLANFHGTALGKFTKRPLVHMGGGMAHGLWHSFTRDATIDQYPGTYLAHLAAGGTIDRFPTCKDHIDTSVRRVLECHENMLPGELGWFGINPARGNYDGLQFDEIEYLMAKSVALDAPISLQTSFAAMEAHPLTPDILEIIRQYEEIRAAKTIAAADRQRLAELQQDFVLLPAALRTDKAKPEFVEMEPVEKAAGTRDVRMLIGSRGEDTVATLWHRLGKEGRLVIRLNGSPAVTAFDVQGHRIAIEAAGNRAAIPIDCRRLVVLFAGSTPAAVREAIGSATLQIRKPEVLWLQAETCTGRLGAMAAGSEAKLADQGALGDFVFCREPYDRTGTTPNYCEYRVDVPRRGQWTLWARVRYPTGGDQSFGLVRAGEEVTLTGNQVLGNCGIGSSAWHWTGRGSGSTSAPPGEPIRLKLEAGPLVFRVYPREGSVGKNAPRLDAFCLTEDPEYVPTDDDARVGLAK